MGKLADAGFNYGSISSEKAASARAAAERIRGRMQLAAESIIEVGRELIEQKKALGHGNFLPWIDAEFGMGERVAQNYMRVCNEFGANTNRVSDLSFKAMLALSYAPAEVREQVEERASKGEKVTAAEIERLKKQLAAAKEKADDAESGRKAQVVRADMMAQKARDAETLATYAEADKQRLADEISALQEEISRLNEDGVIHVQPATQSDPTTITVQAPIPSLLLQVFDKSSDIEVEELLLMRRERIMEVERRKQRAA